MASGLRYEDRLEGATNFSAWKERITLLLEEHELWDIVKATVTIRTDPVDLTAYNKRKIKAKRILLDAVKDHMILHVTGKTHAYEMWEALTNLFQNDNKNRKMVLQEKLHSIKMFRGESVTS